MFRVAFLLLATVTISVHAKCDNACSGHGTCDARSKCTCYDNWGVGLSHDSGDCSDRICPYEFAWVDTPDKLGRHHKYAECAAQGICDRTTGQCACFPGYEGKGCQRTVCPNDCSGHGTCKYIQDLGYQTVAKDFGYERQGFYPQSPKTFDYYNWDYGKTRGCVCDPEYGDIDCSKRLCPYGNDVMDLRLNMNSPQKFQTQYISIMADQTGDQIEKLTDQTFALGFTSQLNETFYTIPLVFSIVSDTYFNTLLDSMEQALRSLPNRVIDDVLVQGNYGTTSAHFNVSFIGDHVQGPQNLLTVKTILCADGCTPKLTGMNLAPLTQNVTEVQMSDFNSFECGRRGKCDYLTGQCTCFAGYTGVACNTITALV